MAEHEHLPLRRLEGELERRKQGGFPGGSDRTPSKHGPKIRGEIEAVLKAQEELPAIDGIDPSLIVRIEMSGIVDESTWERLGLHVLSEDQNRTLLLFATDRELGEFQARVEAYLADPPPGQKGHKYAGLVEAIDSVGAAGPDDRVGDSLASLGITTSSDFDYDKIYVLDIELFHPGEVFESEIFVHRLEICLKEKDGAILNTYIGDRLLLCRVEATGAAIKEALLLPEVANIERPPKPDLSFDDLGQITFEDLEAGNGPKDAAVAIGIIDSGVNFGHPLLAYAEQSAISTCAGWSHADENGHGTSVASLAVYGDVYGRAEIPDFDAQFWVSSARVVDAAGEFPKDVTVPEVMEEAVEKLHADYGCRIFNISLGDPNLVYADGRAGPWAATLDRLARNLDILFVVSTGNQKTVVSSLGENILKEYPSYLLDAGSRILDPATAANVLTVGSLAHANGLESEDEELAGVRPICDAGAPSPFTRSGPGIRGMIKPDLVDYGGNAVWDGPTSKVVSGGSKTSAGIWAFHHEPITRLFRTRSGTSFAAPIVAHKAASLLAAYPDAPASFLRAMLALSADLTEPAYELLASIDKTAPLMVSGHGVASVENAATSDNSRVVLYVNDELALDRFAVYELPIPDIFQTTKGNREIKVSLAFDAPTRRTRADYLGATMGWRLLRGTNEKAVFDKFRKWEEADGDPPEFPARFNCDTFPGPQLREKGTLQCASFRAARDMSKYGDKYYVAVWCRRRWAPKEIETQRFTLCVQLRHAADIELYQSLTVPVQLKA
ncbi:MAG: S8 family peptidase [Pontixanthobacter sp.]